MKYLLHFVKNIHSFAGKVLYLNLFGMVLVSLLEGIGILLLIPLISITGILDFGSNYHLSIQWLNDLFKVFPQDLTLIIILGIYVFIMIGQSFFQRSQMILNTKIQQSYLRHLREEMYKALLYSNWSFYLKYRRSDIINLMTTEIIRVTGGTSMLFNFIASLVFTFIQILLAFWLSPIMTIIVLVFGTVVLFLSKTFIKASNTIGEETLKLGKYYLAGISDHFNGIKDIKSNTLEENQLDWIRSFNIKYESNVIKLTRLKTKSQFIFKVVSAFLIAGFVYFSIKMFQAQPAQVMLIMVIFTRIWPKLSGIQSNLEQIGGIIPSFKYINAMQEECSKSKEIDDKEFANISPLNVNKGIECKNISFRYNQNQPASTLQDINLYFPAKKMTAIVGHSGAGKSTLIDLLMGLNKPEKGQILVDENPLSNQNLLSFRRSISYVAQDPFLFNGTVKENLLMMEPNASDDKLWNALEFSSAAEFVQNLPQGLNTLIGDRGIKLSGGERQRLVLARAILRMPPILILDEATSALDSENEAKIQAALERLKGQMTIIVIAHRLSTIKNADQVIVLDKGRIIQSGEFNQLANDKKGVFNHLLQKQLNAIS